MERREALDRDLLKHATDGTPFPPSEVYAHFAPEPLVTVDGRTPADCYGIVRPGCHNVQLRCTSLGIVAPRFRSEVKPGLHTSGSSRQVGIGPERVDGLRRVGVGATIGVGQC